MNDLLILCPLALAAALVNGAIGYGFSTLVVPVALLLYPASVLTPGLVLAEVVMNLLAAAVSLPHAPRVARRVLPMMIASLPGVLCGSLLLKSASAGGLRLWTFVVLLPLVLLQAAGVRRPIRAESLVSLPVGLGVGVLYATTSISGPPLGLLFNNQGLSRDEFRAAISLFRVSEALATALIYLYLGVYSQASLTLSLAVLPCIVIGVPLGRRLMRGVDSETFRRLCMTFDAWLISFALSRLLVGYGPLAERLRYAPMVLVLVLDVVILVRYARQRAALAAALPQRSQPA